ncbi:MAG: imidazole glycerol phosphate synthase subunit HisH [Planctomycetota bacterium]
MIAIIDYRAGNLQSVLRAVEHLGHEAAITDDHEAIRAAERVIFPGVGAAGATMRNLRELGLDALLRDEIFPNGTPMLGICIGIQILFERSEEDDTTCLGILPGRVRRFDESHGLKIPQIGWNQVTFEKPHPIFRGVRDGAHYYFVNSYVPEPANDSLVYARAEYGESFPCVVGRANLVATQFHLEKSGPVGLKMLDNFCGWDGQP